MNGFNSELEEAAAASVPVDTAPNSKTDDAGQALAQRLKRIAAYRVSRSDDPVPRTACLKDVVADLMETEAIITHKFRKAYSGCEMTCEEVDSISTAQIDLSRMILQLTHAEIHSSQLEADQPPRLPR
jgi:hypothetical protein